MENGEKRSLGFLPNDGTDSGPQDAHCNDGDCLSDRACAAWPNRILWRNWHSKRCCRLRSRWFGEGRASGREGREGGERRKTSEGKPLSSSMSGSRSSTPGPRGKPMHWARALIPSTTLKIAFVR